ncbi:MAG: Asp-tRNA(Asn)/Glu-tRNA(Gln) amidotransferase subunit GatB [Parcubacteria group bacterium]|nr:Asp-tRNA(Asn)/Glu-tRNA(Gln) amidotransferase subunit GatB [Parcubacteria group bacterium]
MSKYITTIGLEIHAELRTQTKMFCDCLNAEEMHPNVNVCPICLAHPGTLPTPNEKAIMHVLRVGAALGGELASITKFDRKNYFYPDIPKGYQISQYDQPLVKNAVLECYVQGEKKSFDIERVHLEEDTGRLLHSDPSTSSGQATTRVDYNRAGVPLMELVTKPVLHTPEEAEAFASNLQLILRYLGVSYANMDKGQMRVEVNISICKEGEEKLGTKVEIKNLNSFRSVGDSIRYEVLRHEELLKKGKKIVQETRGWDENKRITFSQRKKESAHDYRYFPEPDIAPLVVGDHVLGEAVLKEISTKEIMTSLPELPVPRLERLKKEYGLDFKDAEVLVQQKEVAEFFEKSVSEAGELEHGVDKKKIAKLAHNFLISDLYGFLEGDTVEWGALKITPENFGHLVVLFARGEISSRVAKDVLREMFETGAECHAIIEEKGLKQVSDEGALETIAREVIAEFSDAASDYKKGKEVSLQFLVGQFMRKTKGAANPELAKEILKKNL